jgi:FAD/FMN-containing dehydrogenase
VLLFAASAPSDPSWPDGASWERLDRQVGGRLTQVRSPLAVCTNAPESAACAEIFKRLRNPYYLGDEVGLTQTLGWVDAWTSRPSVYAVAARTPQDVVAAVNFARERNLRLVVKGVHGYQSAWLPAALLRGERQSRLADALFAATRHWAMALHVNKGLAGAPAEEVVAAQATAINPEVLDAFALAICAADGPPAYPGIAGHEPDLSSARRRAEAVARAMSEMRTLRPDAASYVSESDFFEADWARAYWGPNYPRLLAVKDAYDPEGLFIVHHGVGSERWSPDGFTRLPTSPQ